jgi:cellulose synthase/poly-beta-1,6-N-acetylglucosamine synthase-like glycosyltransferase
MGLLEILYYASIAVFGTGYLIIILSYTIGWFKLKTYHPAGNGFNTKISVIIPARNEEQNIERLLSDLSLQEYPDNLLEIIIVDDHSTDNTVKIVNDFFERHSEKNIILIQLEEAEQTFSYKKQAISTAIEKSTGNLIVTTDADCSMKRNWLKSIVSFYESHKPKMIVGMVSYHEEKTFFEKMQTLEFLSLIAITGGAISAGRPIMCNGANLAYEREAFEAVGGFGDDSFSSGDDVFLLLKIRKKFGERSVNFLKNIDSIVFTKAKKSIREFFHQRTRWASKNKGYNSRILLVSFTVYMINLLLVTGLIFSIFITKILPVVLLLLLVKLLIDLPILIGIGVFVRRRKIFLYGIPLIILYPVYIILTGALGMVSGYQWKGRKIKN